MQYPANQLIQLASQYHESDYNRLKFGPKGSPIHYRPLSLHLPELFRQLTLRQIHSKRIEVWWLCHSQRSANTATIPILGPAGAQESDLAVLQSQILVAMQEPMATGCLHAPTVKTSLSHPLGYVTDFTAKDKSSLSTPPRSISSVIPPEMMPLISSHLLLSSSPTIFSVPLPFSLDLLLSDGNVTLKYSSAGLHSHFTVVQRVPQSRLFQDGTPVNRDNAASESASIAEEACRTPTDSTALQTQLLGNLYLSSCPGKKVRLDGYTNGRSSVCRDIDMDLKRIKDLGVGCIICCLDDEELTSLGIPWSSYQSSARDMGIDVSRLPTPEGLAPLDPANLDEILNVIIKNYTLRGIPVLAHCRGGVGRAGVIACCWLIKLGLCGWFHSRISNVPEVLQYVGRVIGIIRARRSAKAIETYEQVKFLVEYVEYLRRGR